MGKQKPEISSPYTGSYYFLDGFKSESGRAAPACSSSKNGLRRSRRIAKKLASVPGFCPVDTGQQKISNNHKLAPSTGKGNGARTSGLEKKSYGTPKYEPGNGVPEIPPKSSRRKAVNSYVLSTQKYLAVTRSISLCKCEPYSFGPDSQQPADNSQPFFLNVSTSALILADFHSHLLGCEIIGFLAGKWDSEGKGWKHTNPTVLHVIASYPCKEIASTKNSVEMDPISELQVRSKIAKDNLVVVGWYHSHPTFEPDPSLIDIENQSNYQLLFTDDKTRIDPFVGLIIGPYDARLPIGGVVNNWFHISFVTGKPIPRKLCATLDDSSSGLGIDLAVRCVSSCSLQCDLYNSLLTHRFALDLEDQWKSGEDQTRAEKLVQSVLYLLSSRQQGEIVSAVAANKETAFMSVNQLSKLGSKLPVDKKAFFLHLFDFIFPEKE